MDSRLSLLLAVLVLSVLTPAQAQTDLPVSNRTVSYLNELFRSDVSGSETSFWTLTDVCFEHEEMGTTNMILLLNNTLTSQLSLHTITSSVDQSTLKIKHHIKAASQNGTEYEEQLIEAAEVAGYELELTEPAVFQEATAGNDTSAYTVQMIRGRGWGGYEHVIEVAYITDSTGLNTTYVSELYRIEDYAAIYNLAILAFVLILIGVCSCVAVYGCVWLFYQKKGRLPCFDKQSSEDEEIVGMHPPAS